MSDRLECCVPGCARSIAREQVAAQHNSWICPRHWALVPKTFRRVKARHERQYRRLGFYPREGAYLRLWARIRREAGALPPVGSAAHHG